MDACNNIDGILTNWRRCSAAYGHLAESLRFQSLYKLVNPNHCCRRCYKTVVRNTELPFGGLGCIRRMAVPRRSARKEEIKQNGRKVLSTLQFKWKADIASKKLIHIFLTFCFSCLLTVFNQVASACSEECIPRHAPVSLANYSPSWPIYVDTLNKG